MDFRRSAGEEKADYESKTEASFGFSKKSVGSTA
jgi:hypothetical protein